MELLSNLIWLLVSAALLVALARSRRRGTARLPVSSTLLLAGLLCLILLPAISISDDLLRHQQAQLPLAAQSWRLAVEGSELATEALLAVNLAATWLLVRFCAAPAPHPSQGIHPTRTVARWLTRSQRLRPPLAFSL